jgi:diguanylate cyclase (GGDEF)-like protein
MAFLDELTNIPGRRALMTQLKQIDSEHYTLAMIDIDHFKRLNDSYGHEVGDQALRTIASTLSQHIHSGTLYRYGGEEFVLLFPRKQLDDILDEMESTRVLVSNSDFFLRPKNIDKKQKNQPYMASVHITVSCGVAQKQPLQSYDEVLNIADQALYKAKQTGRNKTVYNKNGKFFELF